MFTVPTPEQLERYLAAEASMYRAKIKQNWVEAYKQALIAVDNSPSQATLAGLKHEIADISQHLPRQFNFKFRFGRKQAQEPTTEAT